MSKFIRTDEMIEKMVMDSFGGDVVQDLKIQILYANGRLKAYSPKLDCYLQFPRKLRIRGATFTCDACEAQNGSRRFYRAYKGTIRNDADEVVA